MATQASGATHVSPLEAGAGRRVTVLIPEATHPNGPVTRSRQRRVLAAFVAMWIVGAVPLAAGASAALKAFGLGLLLPGGGFLYTSDPILAAVAVLAVAGAWFLWWAFGPVLLPGAVWLATAALGATRAGHNLWDWAQIAVPAALALVVVATVVVQRLMFRSRLERARGLNERLASVTFPISGAARVPEVSESSPEELDLLRYPLNLALQPLDAWQGFHTIDQFRESALRYQLNWIQYSLAMSAYTRTPAFTGYLAEAQRNAIEKMLQPRNWRYWRWENLWGNLRWNPDPIVKDNIMISGFLGVMVGMYQSLTGDDRYDQPGALTHRNGDEEYVYEFGSVAEAVRRNHDQSAYCLFPCEPNWIYPLCNTFGINTLLLYDQLHGTDTSIRIVERARRDYDAEFTRPDGTLVAVRSSRFGLSLPSSSSGAQAWTAAWLHPALPEIAQRSWWFLRNAFGDGSLAGWPECAMRSLDAVDPGNYRLGRDTASRGMLLQAAIELGDLEAAQVLRDALDEREQRGPKGGPPYPNVSVTGNCELIMTRFQRPGAIRELINHGVPDAWRAGPILADAAYPDVLVARAVSDGSALDLVLRPGNGGGGTTTLAIERLDPGRLYSAEGATTDAIAADNTGRALVEIDIHGRHQIRVRPAA